MKFGRRQCAIEGCVTNRVDDLDIFPGIGAICFNEFPCGDVGCG